MWCQRCRQDVPGIALVSGTGLGCARCGAQLSGGGAKPAGHTIGVAETAARGLDLEQTAKPESFDPSALELDEWDLEHDFEHLADLPGPPTESHLANASHSVPPPLSGLDLALFAPPSYAPPARAPAEEPATRSTGMGWLFVALGLTALVCGLALLLGATLSGHDTLWNLGLPIAVGGQVVLLLGLALQLERIGQNNRLAADKLQQVDAQLHNLEQAAVRLGNTHSSAAQAFYAHMAEGANPQLLLADVKSQLDLLALRMSQRER